MKNESRKVEHGEFVKCQIDPNCEMMINNLDIFSYLKCNLNAFSLVDSIDQTLGNRDRSSDSAHLLVEARKASTAQARATRRPWQRAMALESGGD